MKIEKLKFKNQAVHLLFLNTYEENNMFLFPSEKLLQIIQLGYDFLVLEGVNFTKYIKWYEHDYNLLSIPSNEYLVQNIRNVDIALKKESFLKEENFFRTHNFLLCTFVKDRYLPFPLRSKMSVTGESWKQVFQILKNFDWNLVLELSERSFFASPDPEVIEQIISIIGLDKSTVEYQEIDYN